MFIFINLFFRNYFNIKKIIIFRVKFIYLLTNIEILDQ
jgi:hypothetical protein